MNPFRTRAILETACWPAPQADAFVQVGDVVEMLIRSKKAQFATCEFCQSVNHLSDARCRTCGGALPPSDEAEAAPATPEAAAPTEAAEAAAPAGIEPGFSEARSLRNVMQLALLPPLLLFSAFAAWTAWRTPPARQPAALVALPASQAPMPRPAPRVAIPARIAPAELGLGPSEVFVSSTRAAASPAEKDDHAETFTPGPAPAEGPAASRPRKAATQSATRLEPNPLAACSNSNFFARAICINSRCADPKVAQFGQCREAIRQRRIDEARRNPSLMG